MKVVILIVVGFIAALKLAKRMVFGHTPVAALAGTSDITVGGPAWQDVLPVVNVHTKSLASAMPAESVAPVVMVAV